MWQLWQWRRTAPNSCPLDLHPYRIVGSLENASAGRCAPNFAPQSLLWCEDLGRVSTSFDESLACCRTNLEFFGCPAGQHGPSMAAVQRKSKANLCLCSVSCGWQCAKCGHLLVSQALTDPGQLRFLLARRGQNAESCV